MLEDELLVLKGHEVVSLLHGREQEIIQAVRLAYEAHGRGKDSLPHSLFLRFPDSPKNRIIALPAYLGDDFQVAGAKWVASFPSNVELGMDRASAVVILNSVKTGRPQAVLEGSIISSKRTAASAVLAAKHLRDGREVTALAVIGCGLINFEVVRFAVATFPELKTLILLDTTIKHSAQFGEKCGKSFPELMVKVAVNIEEALASAPLISFATTAVAPHVDSLSACGDGTTILHISLRDLTPEVILSCDNVVDDIDHVCRAQTSAHLAEQLVGQRDFVRCALADILSGAAIPTSGKRITVFSPFGLGILDLAVSKLACEFALREGAGLVIEDFLPEHWLQRP